MWTEEMVRSHPNTASTEIKCLKAMLNNLSKSVLDWDDTDTASQSMRAQRRMLDMARGAQSLLKEQSK